MNAKIVSVDLAEAHVLVNYSDGSAALFDGDFLYAHRNDKVRGMFAGLHEAHASVHHVSHLD